MLKEFFAAALAAIISAPAIADDDNVDYFARLARVSNTNIAAKTKLWVRIDQAKEKCGLRYMFDYSSPALGDILNALDIVNRSSLLTGIKEKMVHQEWSRADRLGVKAYCAEASADFGPSSRLKIFMTEHPHTTEDVGNFIPAMNYAKMKITIDACPDLDIDQSSQVAYKAMSSHDNLSKDKKLFDIAQAQRIEKQHQLDDLGQREFCAWALLDNGPFTLPYETLFKKAGSSDAHLPTPADDGSPLWDRVEDYARLKVLYSYCLEADLDYASPKLPALLAVRDAIVDDKRLWSYESLAEQTMRLVLEVQSLKGLPLQECPVRAGGLVPLKQRTVYSFIWRRKRDEESGYLP